MLRQSYPKRSRISSWAFISKGINIHTSIEKYEQKIFNNFKNTEYCKSFSILLLTSTSIELCTSNLIFARCTRNKSVKMGIEKLYQSDNYIVINKPYDMYINSDDENEKNTVTYHIASPDSHLSSSVNPLHFVQRLDYATSGVLCIAKTKTAAAKAGKLFEKRNTRKYYLAVFRGHVEFELADVEFDVGIDPLTADSSHRMVAVTSNMSTVSLQPRQAHTRMLVLETGFYDTDPVTVVLMKPITGRRHQLRVHSNALGHTILGDYTYSRTADSTPHRMFLHATRLVLPLQQEPLDIQTAEPFFSDQQFSSKWKSKRMFYKYRSKEDFATACDIIDKSYVIGIQYKLFSCNN